jgi:DNA mismatch endonuclease (patch repair protein)
VEYWKQKFWKNIEKDKAVKKELEELGWRVVVIWECEISLKKDNSVFTEKLTRDLINE